MIRFMKFGSAYILGALLPVMLVAGTGQTQWMIESSAPMPEGLQIEDVFDQPAESESVVALSADPDSLLFVPGIGLKPRTNNVDWSVTGGGGCIHATDGDSDTIFNTPIYLPQGATVRFMRLFYRDTHTEKDCRAWFTIYQRWGVIQADYGASSTGSAGVGYATTEEFSHTVDYNHFSYVVNWRPNHLGSEIQACGFRIYYDAPTLKARKIEIGPPPE